jgi:hypothetical protein
LKLVDLNEDTPTIMPKMKMPLDPKFVLPAENSPKANVRICERFRVVLNGGTISQWVPKDKYKV